MKVITPEQFRDHTTSNICCVAKGDTGASHHYWMHDNKTVLSHIKNSTKISVRLPNSEVITSSQEGILPLSPLLSDKAKTAIILPKLTSSNLISIGQLCNDGCNVIMDKDKMVAIKDNQVVLKGIRNKLDGLWDIPITKTSITTNCCDSPALHGGLYKQQTLPQQIPPSIPLKKPNISKLPHHLNHLLTLAKSNDFDNALETQRLVDGKANIIIKKKQTHLELVNYLHAACFSPTKSTFIAAIKKGFLKSWPGLTAKLVDKYLNDSVATAQGHLNQQRQHLQSTKSRVNVPDMHPIDELCKQTKNLSLQNTINNVNSNDLTDESFTSDDVAYIIINHDYDKVGYIDSTGRFPQRSSRGHEYILVGYHFNGNAILAAPIKDRSAQSLTKAWESIHKMFIPSNNIPNIYVLDNEKSTDLINAFIKNNVKYQLAPPHMHRTNLAERAIQTFKSHFKAGLATCDPSFPLCEWDRLITQSILTLNMLRPSRTNPNISAHTFLFGEFDFLSTPLAPPGSKVVAHIKPTARNSWDLNGSIGYYVGPAQLHYRCVTCYFPRTRSERICDTVKFISNVIPFPKTTIDDYLRQAATDIIHILEKPPSTTYPTLTAGDPVRNALHDLATQIGRAQTIESTSDTTPSTTSKPSTFEIDSAPPRVVQDTAPPRVQLEGTRQNTPTCFDRTITTTALDPIHTELKNRRFNNSRAHRYPLRSLSRRLRSNAVATHSSSRDHFVNHVFDAKGTRLSIDTLLKGKDNTIWTRSLSNEWGRLLDGNDFGVQGTKTCHFISRTKVPRDRDVTYATYVCDVKPLKSETHRVRITVGGDRLSCADDTGSPAANMLETKILVNSTISDAKHGARFLSADIVSYFLASPMHRKEYMKVKASHIPHDIKIRYNVDDLTTKDGYVYVEIVKGMYGLKNAAILAYDNLKKNLEKFGYYPVQGTVGVWAHRTRRTRFCVCVDDFGVKYFTKADANHLLEAIGSSYKYTVDWKGEHYCGLTLNWQYDQNYVEVSMPDYVTRALKRLAHTPSVFPQFSPHQHVPIRYSVKGDRQYATAPDDSPLLSPKDKRHLQSIIGTLLYYGRALDYTILPALNDIAREQATPTVNTMKRAKRVLDYVATYPHTTLRFHASSMILCVDSDAAYLVAPRAKSRIAGFYFLSTDPRKNQPSPSNGGVLVECRTLRHVVASAAEAEVAGIFHNAQVTISVRRILHALGHVQPPTPIKTDNSTANGFIHNNIHQKRSKSWDMRYYWLRDKNSQKQMKFFWEKGVNNLADYFTKHHPTKHHRTTRQKYVLDKNPTYLQKSFLANHAHILYKNLHHACQNLSS